MTHSPLHSLRPQPLQSPVAFPTSTHAHTSAAARLNIHLPPPPLPSSPLSTTRMPSSLEEPHNYFLWETYCSRSPLSLITIKQKREEGPGVLLWCCLLLAPLLFSPRQMAEHLHVNTTLNTQHHIPWQRGDVKHGVCVKQIVKIWMQICWLFFFNFVVLFWGCDVSLTKASMLFCYKPKFQFGHPRVLIPAASEDFVPLEETQAVGIWMCARRVWASLSLYCRLWSMSSHNAFTQHKVALQ